LYIPLAVHKNELVVINNMDTFSHYFCLAKKQKMTPLSSETGRSHHNEEIEEEGREFFDDGVEVTTTEDDDDL